VVIALDLWLLSVFGSELLKDEMKAKVILSHNINNATLDKLCFGVGN
jgi:hypothetical protein